MPPAMHEHSLVACKQNGVFHSDRARFKSALFSGEKS